MTFNNIDITIKNREYKITDVMPISEQPYIAAANPNIEASYIAVGKRGSVITGYIFKNGSYNVF